MAGRRNDIDEDGAGLGGPKPAAWSVRASRYSFRDRWLAVRSDQCTAADGTIIAPYDVVELPDWVNILALTLEQEIVLVREYRHGTGEITLELPSGTVEAGEAPLATAQRELREETGYGGGRVVLPPIPPDRTISYRPIWPSASRRSARRAPNPARSSKSSA